jgi:hypothetical protein
MTWQNRLERVIKKFETSAQEVGDDVVAILPLLQRMGLGTLGGATQPPQERAELRLPQYIGEEPEWTKREKQPSEREFVKQFQQVVASRGFEFSRDDLVNFHTCIKSGDLTILAGQSGTGKSSLPYLYAEALGARDQFLHVAVRPDWLDDRDFLGAFNPLARRFDPGNSGVVEHLIAAELDAQREHDRIFTICLDEMNLARVEHYFAQFLSVLERPLSERRVTVFPPGSVPQRDDPFGPYQHIGVGDNVRIVGTVNIDETTHFFSPKVLDRAQVICFKPPVLGKLTSPDSSERLPGVVPVSLATYRSWSVAVNDDAEVRKQVDNIDAALRASRQGLGPRQYLRILRFVSLAGDLLGHDQALDYQVIQVVLPRLRRHVPKWNETLNELKELLPGEQFPRSYEMIELMSEPGHENDFFQLI